MTEKETLHKALVTIKKLKQLLNEQNRTFEPIAITGLSCRFPQAHGKDAYWEMLCQGRNVISKMPQERWDLLKETDEIDLRDPSHPYWGGWLEDISLFDAYFFGISPREAIRMDPQHRLILEVAHEAIEDAGIAVESLAGSNTGVFASLYVSQLAHMQKMDAEMDALYLPTGNAIAMSANRLSYLFDFHGPSLIIDSACSSSMASLSLACLHLQTKVCDLALVCGAKLNLIPYVNYVLTKAKMLSADGQCKTFDEQANGYVQGEGVGVVVLKPLAKALQDNDRIYAVINGCAVNQDGRTNGLTAPNGLQQEELISTACRVANVSPSEVAYVECHGTGTFLGDPIEIQALGEVLGKDRSSEQPLIIGSVKTNLGHLEPAAGMASIIKVALSLHHGQIPPHLNCTTLNPHIDFNKYQIKIASDLQPWPKYSDYRIAGVSGFGFGGSNAHIILRESPVQQVISLQSKQTELFVLSAKTEWALEQVLENWSHFLRDNNQVSLATLCYNTHVRRSHYTIRLAVIVDSVEQLRQYLTAIKENKMPAPQAIFKSNVAEKNTRRPTVPDNLTYVDLATLAQLYVAGANINWQKIEADRKLPAIDLPLYPWQHKSYWPPLGTKHTHTKPEQNDHPLAAQKVSSPLTNTQFEFKISRQSLPDLQDTYNIFHAGYYLEIMAYVVQNSFKQKHFTLEDHQFLSPIIIPETEVVTIQLILTPDGNDFRFQFFSKTADKAWLENANGKLNLQKISLSRVESVAVIKQRCKTHEGSEQLYEKIAAMGMPAGASIRWTQQYWLSNTEILCDFQAPESSKNFERYSLAIHPSVFDAAIQPVFKLLPAEIVSPYIAAGAKKLHFNGMIPEPLFLWGRIHHIEEGAKKIVADCCLINQEGLVQAYFEGITLTQLDNKLHTDDILKSKSIAGIDFSTLSLAERKEIIIRFLGEQIAVIFSLPEQDVAPYATLRELGIDSLMALVLVRAIEVGLSVQYSMQDLLEGPTITELAAEIAQRQQPGSQGLPIVNKPSSALPNPWISHRINNEQADYRLFCFPYGGGGASIYREWQKSLPSNIEVCPIQLPGREERLNETPIDNLNNLVALLYENLKDELDKPFIFFGHSFGSLIAFELSRFLREKNIEPKHIFVSGFPDPRVPSKSLDRLIAKLNTVGIGLNNLAAADEIEKLSTSQLNELAGIFNENGLVGYGEYLYEKEIMKILLPIFTGDMSIVKSYNYYDALRLDVPLTVFAGKQDAWVHYDDHFGWQAHTAQKCEIISFDASHMFVREPAFRKAIQEKIAAICNNKD